MKFILRSVLLVPLLAAGLRAQGQTPTLYVVGDSTARSDAPLRGWGSEIGAFFDPEKINDARTHSTPEGAKYNAAAVVVGLKALSPNPLANYFSKLADDLPPTLTAASAGQPARSAVVNNVNSGRVAGFVDGGRLTQLKSEIGMAFPEPLRCR